MFRKLLNIVYISFTLLLLCFSITAQAQQSVKGKIFNHKGNPVTAASIILQGRAGGYASDKEGKFSIPGRILNNSDTLVITSIGYKTLRIPAATARAQKEFFLEEEAQTLEPVTVKNYTNQASEGSTSEKTGYFRSWPTLKGRGEIGMMIYIKSDDYIVDRVRFKVNSQCDTCIIRLHIRSLTNGLPDEDLLKDSVSIVTTRQGFDDKYLEFNLSKYNLILRKQRYVFVGFETLNCFSSNGNCSLAYIGTEKGSYLYRNRDYAPWEESRDHSLYMKMYYRY